MALPWSWAALRLQAEDVWQQFLFQWDLATAGAQDMQWVDTLDFVWDSLTDGDKLTAKEKRQIAASLRHLVRQQSTDLYHKQQHHKEAIMRRQAMLAQMHLEQLASKWLEQMVTMSHIAREQSMLLPAASELLAGISSSSQQQQLPATADARQQQWQQTAPDAAQQQGSSRVRLPQQQQWQRPERSRLSAASCQRLPSVLEQQGSLAQLLLADDPAAPVQGSQSDQCQQQSDSKLEFGPLSELEPAQECGSGQQSSGTSAVVIDIQGDHFTFLPLAAAAAAASTSASWPTGREVLSGSSSSSSNSRLGDRQEDRVSRGGSSSSWWRGWGGGGEVPQGGLTEPLLQQQEVTPMLACDGAGSETAAEAGVCSLQAYQAQQVATCPPTIAAYQCTTQQQQQQQQHSVSAGSSRWHLPAAAGQADTAQLLLLERYLSSSDAGTPHDLSAAAAAAAAAVAAVAAASECSAGGAAPAGTLDSVHSQDSIGSSSTDCTASSEQPVHHTSHHQQQRGPDRVAAAAAGDLMRGGAEAVPGPRCSCDTSSGDVDTPRKAPGQQVVGGTSLVQQQQF